jgi:SAM-dependent methyltransferase
VCKTIDFSEDKWTTKGVPPRSMTKRSEPVASEDPLAGSLWSDSRTVAGFTRSAPNATLMRLADAEWRAGARIALDIGCGAGRNAVPLARVGWAVLGCDLSRPMLTAAVARAIGETPVGHTAFVLAPMDELPAADGRFDLVIAHGIWNLATSAREFRRAVHEAARAAKTAAAVFVFTFSRNTLRADAVPVAGEPFVFTAFSGRPQCFLTAEQLISELARAGLSLDPRYPLSEHNLPTSGTLTSNQTPVIYEGVFRRR